MGTELKRKLLQDESPSHIINLGRTCCLLRCEMWEVFQQVGKRCGCRNRVKRQFTFTPFCSDVVCLAARGAGFGLLGAAAVLKKQNLQSRGFLPRFNIGRKRREAEGECAFILLPQGHSVFTNIHCMPLVKIGDKEFLNFNGELVGVLGTEVTDEETGVISLEEDVSHHADECTIQI